MDSSSFDRLTRLFASAPTRRGLSGALLGSLVGVLSVAIPEEVEAHNFLARCRKIKNKRQRAACLRRARAHNRTHRCTPQSPALTCAGRCGTATNNCGQAVTCACATGQQCLTDGQCCTPDAPFITCRDRCGTVANNCGQAVACQCRADEHCLSNGSCAEFCTDFDCPGGCSCYDGGGGSASKYCVPLGLHCGHTTPCPSSGCPTGQHCMEQFCDGVMQPRCFPLC